MIDDDDNETTPPRRLTDSDRHAHFETYPPGTAAVRELATGPRTAFEHQLHERVSSLEGSRQFWRWVAGLGVPAIVTVIITFGFWSADKIERVGETAAEIRALEKQVDRLEHQIDLLLKLSGMTAKPISIVGGP